MKQLRKKVLSAFLALTVTLAGIPVFKVSAADEYTNADYEGAAVFGNGSAFILDEEISGYALPWFNMARANGLSLKDFLPGGGAGTYKDFLSRGTLANAVCKLYALITKGGLAYYAPSAPPVSLEDVSKYDYYVHEAIFLKLMSPVSAARFGSGDIVTREQMANTIMSLYREASFAINGEYPAVPTDSVVLDAFKDKGEIAGWAKNNVAAAISLGFVSGVSAEEYKPKAQVTIEQGLAGLTRVFEKTAKKIKVPITITSHKGTQFVPLTGITLEWTDPESETRTYSEDEGFSWDIYGDRWTWVGPYNEENWTWPDLWSLYDGGSYPFTAPGSQPVELRNRSFIIYYAFKNNGLKSLRAAVPSSNTYSYATDGVTELAYNDGVYSATIPYSEIMKDGKPKEIYIKIAGSGRESAPVRLVFETDDFLFDSFRLDANGESGTVEWFKVDGAAKYSVKVKEHWAMYPRVTAPTAKTYTVASNKITLGGAYASWAYYDVTVTALDASGKAIKSGRTLIRAVQIRPLWADERVGAYSYNKAAFNFSTKEQAQAQMKTITINVWNIDKNGNKFATTKNLTIHRLYADDAAQIFKEIFEGPEKFPIKSIGGFEWRSGNHGIGAAIDINPDENYMPGRAGNYWKPYEDPYSITPGGDVVKAFRKHGWGWGASFQDYMHFSANGG